MENQTFGMGWIRDLPDIRDFTMTSARIKGQLKTIGLHGEKPLKIPAAMDLRPWCSLIDNQDGIGCCTAEAGVGLYEYCEKRAFGAYVDGSELFLYKVTRDLLGWTGDTGAYCRTTMGAMVLFGIAPDHYWPFVPAKFDVEPTPFLYSLAQNYQALAYYRLDPPGTVPANLLANIKNHLACGLALMFGFTCYSSIWSAVGGKIPFPQMTERVVGGHAIVAVGYDDSIVITNGTVTTRGALLIRNSWGTGWGMAGYGYLPYEYVLRGLAVDWWALIREEWVNTGNFGLPTT